MNIKSKLAELRASLQPSIREFKFSIKLLSKSPLSIVGIGLLTIFVIIAICAPILAPPVYRDPFKVPQDWDLYRLTSEPVPPTLEHPFGTTQMQFDIYYACIWGTITAFRIGITVVAATLIVGIVLGLVAGYYGGLIDEIIMRFTDIIIAFPGLILAMALVMAMPNSFNFNLSSALVIIFGVITFLIIIFKPGQRLLLISFTLFVIFLYSMLNSPLIINMQMNNLDKVMIALVLVGWPGYTRLIRGEVLRVKNEDFIEAAKASGCSDLRIILKHIIPNAIYPVIIVASLDTGSIVLSAAALSFLGLGAPPDYADWGQIIERSRAWILQGETLVSNVHVFLIPGIFIATFVLGWNLLGDAIRDVMDPTLRRR
jgi:peptide/nickel transport system permease protein